MKRILCAGLALLLTGCVERTLLIRSEPPGATVLLNGDPVGVTPLKMRFDTYGVYDALLSAPGHKRLRAEVPVRPPWFERFGIDFITETILPWTLHDDHEVTLRLEAMGPDDDEVLIQARDEWQRRRLQGADSSDSERK